MNTADAEINAYVDSLVPLIRPSFLRAGANPLAAIDEIFEAIVKTQQNRGFSYFKAWEQAKKATPVLYDLGILIRAKMSDTAQMSPKRRKALAEAIHDAFSHANNDWWIKTPDAMKK